VARNFPEYAVPTIPTGRLGEVEMAKATGGGGGFVEAPPPPQEVKQTGSSTTASTATACFVGRWFTDVVLSTKFLPSLPELAYPALE
jgi:hypothetical protein